MNQSKREINKSVSGFITSAPPPPAFSIGSVASAISFFARFRAANNSSKINGRMPFLVVERTKI